MLPLSFKPKELFDLVRIGKNNDGGYLVCKNSLKETELLISFGIGNDFSFEENFFKLKKVSIHAYDPSINYKFFIKIILSNLINLRFNNFFLSIINFFKFYQFFDNQKKIIFYEKLGSGGNHIWTEVSLKKVFERSKTKSSIFLKIDIEGSEYRILDDILINQDRLTGLVIEFHNVDLNIDRIKTFIKDINLQLVHIHPNNYANLGLNNIPTSLEITFSKNPIVLSEKSDFPHPLDQPNNPLISDIELKFNEDF